MTFQNTMENKSTNLINTKLLIINYQLPTTNYQLPTVFKGGIK